MDFSTIDPFWFWLVLALAFLALEVLVLPSGFLLCVATAAGIVAVITFFADIPWLWSSTIFALLLLPASYGWWKFIRNRKEKDPSEELGLNARAQRLLGYTATLTEPVVHGKGRLRVNDSSWPVIADTDYPAGTRVTVMSVNGITLTVKAAGEE